ncbi:hypothetical protein GCM10023169_16950 [Georgenia halophila]|uniref:YqeB PH domain-containing protein n=1 Tax=Georgenia halophila TaxID=620889 RepID=A0ABP8L6F2_9MICO
MTPPSHESPTRVSLGRGWALACIAALTAAGALLGLALRPLVRFLESHDLPRHAAMDLLARLPAGLEVAALGLVGALAGTWFWTVWRREALALTVEPDGMILSQEGHDRFVARQSVESAHLDGPDLVLRSADGRELARRDAGAVEKSLRNALTGAGYR